MVWLVATAVLLIGYAFLIRYYHRHFKKLPLFSAAGCNPTTFVSVLVAARNEEATLPHLLHALAKQTYPRQQFEIIVVDDFSTDDTSAVVQTFSNVHAQVVQPQAAPAHSSKKRALEAGIARAKGPLLLITDADCVPGPDWIKTMVAFHETGGAVFIAAPVRFTHNNSFLQIFQALDFLTLQGITAASVAAHAHSMCNGANLAYTKKAFLDVNGFAGIDHVASGDDMLLMYKIWQQHKQHVQYVKSFDAIVRTTPMHTWRAFFAQRRRWASKTAYYNDKRVLGVLLFVYGFNCWFLALCIAGFWEAKLELLALFFLVLKTTIEWPFVKDVARFYGDEKLVRFFPFFQPFHIAYTISIGILSQLGTYAWKGRRTR